MELDLRGFIRNLIRNTRYLLNGEPMYKMSTWYRGFEGSMSLSDMIIPIIFLPTWIVVQKKTLFKWVSYPLGLGRLATNSS